MDKISFEPTLGRGTKVACFPAMYTNTGNSFLQNTVYYYHTANVQSGLLVSENQGFESPYDGRIFGVSHAFRTVGGSSALPIILSMRIRKSKGFDSGALNGHENRGVREVLVTNKLMWNANHGIFYPCDIPIKRKELFIPKILTPAWGAGISGILSELQIFIEGD